MPSRCTTVPKSLKLVFFFELPFESSIGGAVPARASFSLPSYPYARIHAKTVCLRFGFQIYLLYFFLHSIASQTASSPSALTARVVDSEEKTRNSRSVGKTARSKAEQLRYVLQHLSHVENRGLLIR